MSLYEQDITNRQDLMYILTSKTAGRIMGGYFHLSQAITDLYLADEPCVLSAIRTNTSGKLCLNEQYDCLIGSFFFNDETLCYQRHLSGETIDIEDPTCFIDGTDVTVIKNELKRVSTERMNPYHDNAHKMTDLAIHKRFKQLSYIVFHQLNPLIMRVKNLLDVDVEADLTFDYHLTYEINKFYQTTCADLLTLSLEDKITVLERINDYLHTSQDELEVIKSLLHDLQEEPDADAYGVDWEAFAEDCRSFDNVQTMKSTKSVTFNLTHNRIYKY